MNEAWYVFRHMQQDCFFEWNKKHFLAEEYDGTKFFVGVGTTYRLCGVVVRVLG
jgi:hypothetical protein